MGYKIKLIKDSESEFGNDALSFEIKDDKLLIGRNYSKLSLHLTEFWTIADMLEEHANALQLLLSSNPNREYMTEEDTQPNDDDEIPF